MRNLRSASIQTSNTTTFVSFCRRCFDLMSSSWIQRAEAVGNASFYDPSFSTMCYLSTKLKQTACSASSPGHWINSWAWHMAQIAPPSSKSTNATIDCWSNMPCHLCQALEIYYVKTKQKSLYNVQLDYKKLTFHSRELLSCLVVTLILNRWQERWGIFLEFGAFKCQMQSIIEATTMMLPNDGNNSQPHFW